MSWQRTPAVGPHESSPERPPGCAMRTSIFTALFGDLAFECENEIQHLFSVKVQGGTPSDELVALVVDPGCPHFEPLGARTITVDTARHIGSVLAGVASTAPSVAFAARLVSLREGACCP